MTLGLGIIAAVAVAVLAILVGTSELGYRAGRRSPSEGLANQAATWEAALLGLLALLIGFTFAMAVTRFDGRRELIMEEANAIEETMLLAEILDPPQRQEVRTLLHHYVDVRARFYSVSDDRQAIEAAQRDTLALEEQLWSHAIAAARADRHPEVMALFVTSTADLVRAASKRRAALDNHVPHEVMLVLLLVAATATATTGYSCGLHGRRHGLGMTLLPVLIAIVVLMVLDLDHPRIGLIHSGQAPMVRLQQRSP